MDRLNLSLRFGRIAKTSGLLLVGAVMTVLATMWTFATPPFELAGPMHDRMLEEENGGVPVAVVRRRADVMQALESAQSAEWAGEYYEGDGLGENVTLMMAPDAGIAATWLGCGGAYASNEGAVDDLSGGRLAFRFNRPNQNNSGGRLGTFPQTVTLVRWGARRYLLAEDQMIDFVNAIHHGWEPRKESHGFFLLAKDDETLLATGLPTLPAEFLAYLRSSPLVVRLTSVESVADVGTSEYPECKYRVHFNVPAGEHVPVALEFKVRDPQTIYDKFTVVASTGTEVTAEGNTTGDCLISKRRPTPDWVLTSGAYPASRF